MPPARRRDGNELDAGASPRCRPSTNGHVEPLRRSVTRPGKLVLARRSRTALSSSVQVTSVRAHRCVPIRTSELQSNVRGRCWATNRLSVRQSGPRRGDTRLEQTRCRANERLQHRSATPAKRGSSRFADTRRSRSPHRWIQAQVRRVRPDVLHEKHQVEIVGGDRLELGHEVQVEGSGFVGLRVHSSRSMSLRSPGSSRAGRWLIASHAARASASSSNRSRSARTRRAASTAWATTNSVRSVSVTAVARSIRSRSSGVVRSSSRRLRRRVSIVRHRGLPDDGVRPMDAHGATSQPTSTESARGRSGRCSTRSPLSAFAIDSTV